MSFISQQHKILTIVDAAGVDVDVNASTGTEEDTITTSYRPLPWQLRWKRPRWHRLRSSSPTNNVDDNSNESATKSTSTAAVTTAKSPDPLVESSPVVPVNKGTSGCLLGHASTRITVSEYQQHHQQQHSEFDTATEELICNVSIFQSGHDCHPVHSQQNSMSPVADVIKLDIIRQRRPPTWNDDMNHDDDDDDGVRYDDDAALSYEYVHQKTLYWPNTTTQHGRRTKRRTTTESEEDIIDTTSGPCTAILLRHNPLLQLFHHVLLPWMPSHRPHSNGLFQSSIMDVPPLTPSTAATAPSVSTAPKTNHRERRTRNDDSNHSRSTTMTGVIAVTFVRVPQRHENAPSNDRRHPNDTAAAAMTLSTADALDILNLLSLQPGNWSRAPSSTNDPLLSSWSLHHQQNNNNHNHNEANTSTTAFNGDSNTFSDPSMLLPSPTATAEEEEATDLLLACLTNDGKVHLYSPWQLLFKDSNNHLSSNSNGMASFWFGSGTATNLLHGNHVLPFHDSIASIELSIPYLQKVIPQNPSTSPNSTAVSLPENRTKKQPPPSLISMFDTSMWDATLDPSTLHHQTIHNVPTHCIAVHDEYICIVGRGQKRWHDDPQHHVDDDEEMDVDDEVDVTFRRNVECDYGGFVTFISTNTMSEKRTLFLPFIPAHISPFLCFTMKLLLITGQGHAIAIRVDGGSAIVPILPLSSSQQYNEDTMLNSPKKQQSTVSIHRFQILPIEFSNIEHTVHYPTVIGGEILTSPPAVVLIFDEDSNRSRDGVYVVRQTLSSLEMKQRPHKYASQYQHHPDAAATTVVITTNQHDTPTAWIPLVRTSRQNIWCQLGQGWCIVGAGQKSFFICYEGSSKEVGPVIKELSPLDVGDNDIVVHSSILAAPQAPNHHGAATLRHDLVHDRLMPSSATASDIPGRSRDIHSESADDVEVIDDILIEAMESISNLTLRESYLSNSPTSVSRRNRQLSLTTQEKSERLLRHCSSWTKLDQSLHSRSAFQSQRASITLRTQGSVLSILTLRRVMIEHGPAAPFQRVLAWLSMQNDYFTAASIALNLLQDIESLRHLWLDFRKMENDEPFSQLDGLLDGILPIGTDRYDAILTQLADMTVACLAKGGYSMSSTLEQFLSRNTIYDPSRASLMLVASATGALSDDVAHAASVMGPGYARDENHMICTLWPVRCLLKLGVARHRLGTVLLLLNTAIPDELRRRNRVGSRAVTQSSLDLCKSIVTLIVETSSDSAEILLDLVDERSRQRYWESLDHETRLELSVIGISESYPLLRDHEIRSWTLAELQKCVESEDLASAANVYDKTPTVWLRAITLGCLQNAGCDMKSMLHPTMDRAAEDVIDRGGFYEYRETVKISRQASTPTANTGRSGLDFDIIIPAMLVLDRRNETWHTEAQSDTRVILNAVCYQAGRGKNDESLFVMNSSVLMRQCFRLGNVEAGANLIGGKNGFILQICDTLNEELALGMDDAERYALGESFTVPGQHSITLNDTFPIRDCHRRLLLLLDEHVLRIRKYGEFTASRGTIDPVFAATLFFRTWWAITRPMLSAATKWLTEWLRQQLNLSIFETSVISPHRLACAALIQALIWPQGNDSSTSGETVDTIPLANKLEMDGIFLLQMAQSCCGMVEALPAHILESNLNSDTKVVATMKSSLSPISRRMTSAHDTSINSRSEFDIDDSFVSAVGTYRDMDVSHTTWNT